MLQTLYTIIFLIPSLVYRRRQCVGNKCVLVCARVGLFVLFYRENLLSSNALVLKPLKGCIVPKWYYQIKK